MKLRVAWKSGTAEGVSVAWGIVDLPGRPFIVSAMVNHSGGDHAREAVRRVGRVSHEHFARLAGATPYGTRVPLRYFEAETPTGGTRR